jgi:hypothetical protein
MTSAARNWFFNTDNLRYWARPEVAARQHQFLSEGQGALSLPLAFGVAALYAAVSSYVGLKLGLWMTKVRR